jgi:hypothetical protein
MNPVPTTRNRTHRAFRLAVLPLAAGLALWSTWPLARSGTTSLPLGGSSIATVPLFNVWSVWWNADRLRHAFAGYWDAPVFHPVPGAFTFSDPQPATLIVAPLIWATGSRVLAYNVYLWLSLALNGVLAHRLLRWLGCGPLIANGGAAATILLPIVHWQRDVLQLVPVWTILWTWTALWQITRRSSVWRGLELGMAFSAACWTCLHQGLFLAILLVGATVTLCGRWRTIALWRSLAVAVLVAAALVSPIVIPIQRGLALNRFTRSQQSVAALSAQPGDYAMPFGRHWLDIGAAAARPEWPLSPGWLKYGLALLGAAFGLTRRRWRWWTTFLLVTGGLAFTLSLGANLRIGDWQPYWTLMDHVPGLSRARNVFRFAFFVQLAVVLLAFQGLHLLSTLGRCARRGGVPRRLLVGGSGLLAFAAVCEVVPTAPRLATVPDAVANAGWISFVRQQTPRGRAVACIPFAPGNNAADFEPTTRWMYLATYHEARLVNGYSGYFPVVDFELRRIVKKSFPSEAALACLTGASAEFIVCERTAAAPDPLDPGPYGPFRLEHAYADPIGIDVYRLRRTRP